MESPCKSIEKTDLSEEDIQRAINGFFKGTQNAFAMVDEQVKRAMLEGSTEAYIINREPNLRLSVSVHFRGGAEAVFNFEHMDEEEYHMFIDNFLTIVNSEHFKDYVLMELL